MFSEGSSSAFLISYLFCYDVVTGSLGARVTELKQKIIAENPRRYGLAVPRKSSCFSVSVVKMLWLSPEFLLVAVMPVMYDLKKMNLLDVFLQNHTKMN